MKRSVILFLALLITLIITDRVVSGIITKLGRNIYTGQTVGKVNYFIDLKDSVDVLVFGSSRASHHVNNNKFSESSFNMGVDGKDLSYASALISSLSRKEQLILLHIDPKEILNPAIEVESYSSLKHLYLTNSNIRSYIKDHDPVLAALIALFPSYSYNGVLFSIIGNRIRSRQDYAVSKGFEPIYPNKHQEEIFLEKLRELAPDSTSLWEDLNVSLELDGIIDEINAKCLLNNSDLVFFTSPTLIPEDAETRKRVDLYFEDKGITYFDFAHIFSADEPDHWKDLTHLSFRGAELFTIQLLDSVTSVID